MHTEKIKIFDEYAKSQGYKNWEELLMEFDIQLMTFDEFSLHLFAACDLVQKEQQKRIAENAKIEKVYTEICEFLPDPFELGTKIDKDSILSENNLIK